MFNFIRNCHTDFHSGCIILHFDQGHVSTSCSTSSLALGMVSIFKFSHSSRHVVVSRGFNVSLTNG